MALMSQPAVSIQGLGFRYPGTPEPCFQHLNLEIAAGDRFGLFGPNGAGKTTLMNCMTGLLSFKEGSIRLFGHDTGTSEKAVKQLFGFVPQDFSFYHELSPAENLSFFGAWSGLKKAAIKQRTEELLEVLDLTGVFNKPVHKFSGGMKRKG
jgi:ABC-2 type transport system ATP-binding protein